MGARASKQKSPPLHRPRYKALTRLLKAMREEAGLTQRDLAAELGVVHSMIAKCEQAERRIDPIEFIDWSIACGVKPEDAIKRLLR